MIFSTKSSLNSMNHNQILKWYDTLDNQTLVIDTFLDKAVKTKFALTVLPLDRYNAHNHISPNAWFQFTLKFTRHVLNLST